MALRWSDRRKMLYSGVAIIIAAALLIFAYETFFTSTPTCFDGKQDGNETGIDCGGGCSLLCPDTAHQPTVSWARAFQTSPNTYTAAAYLQNTNVGAGVESVNYSFKLFDANNSLVIEQDGTAQLPPVQTIPIIEPNINVGNRAVVRTLFAFSSPNMNWIKVPASSIPTLSTSQQNLSADGSRLSVTLTNNSLTDAHNVTVAAVLFDASDTAQAASKSIIADVPAKSSVPVVFTWPGGISNIVQAQITVLPSF